MPVQVLFRVLFRVVVDQGVPGARRPMHEDRGVDVVAIVVIIALKFLIPIGIPFAPFAFGWANFVLDTIDGDLLVPLGLSDATYQPIDKLADWATYVGMAAAAWRGNWSIRRWVYGLFAFRSVGQVLFLLTGAEWWLFVFANFLEPLFLVYATARAVLKDEARTAAWFHRHRVVITVLVVLYKLQDEYVTHIGNIDRTDVIVDLFR